MLITLLLATFAGAGVAGASDTVFYPPAVVTAGVPTTIKFDYNASSCKDTLEGGPNCDWPFFRLELTADPRFNYTGGSDDSIFLISRMCNLAACISTNLTSFNVTVPPSAVPNGAPYSLDYKLFDFHPNGTAREFSPIWSGFEGSRFSIAGSNKTDPPWTRYDHRYEPDNFFRPWYGNVSCEALACAMACANDLAAPSVPFVKTDFPELDACVEACPGYGWDPRVCVTENAVDEGGDAGGEEDEGEGGGPSGSSTVTAPLRPTEGDAAASETASSTSPSSGSKTVLVAQWGSWVVVLVSVIMIRCM